MPTRLLWLPVLPARLHRRRDAAVPPPPRPDRAIELGERTLDDIGAPEWLRAEARAARGATAWRNAERSPCW